jgi:hypothetical protein
MNKIKTDDVVVITTFCDMIEVDNSKIDKKYEIEFSNFCSEMNGDMESMTLTDESIYRINKIKKVNLNETNHKEILSFFCEEYVDMEKLKYDVNIKYKKQ